ncbi:low affinity immunoglobulin gamma Fc region receptor II-a-like [Colossoma macropomum]|uniref:low affinity immunoglobulin gamma Fc region receptor II-a-like n=1 Tax=Colossoma macropomum TaxID=42526 RepID=UPI0018646C02|nr:low affinity immunoglobulin gamma Fc region receptor II-a-like [Colossoma macropomum]
MLKLHCACLEVMSVEHRAQSVSHYGDSMEFRSLSVILSLTVLMLSGHTDDQPVVKIKEPSDQKEIFIGETVTLMCEIKGEEGRVWTYSWYKNGNVQPSEEQSEYTFKATEIDTAEFTCKGTRTQGDPMSTKNSGPVKLSVSDKPKPTLTVDPESPVFSGESVTLKCEINPRDGWTYQWYKQNKQSRWTAVPQSEYYTVNRDTLTIREDAVINGDQYQCRGERRYRPTSSQYSDSVTLTVKVVPRATLTVEPESSVFTAESVTLKCEINPRDGWTYQWYKQNKQSGWTAVSQSVNYTVNRDTLTIRGDAVIDGDQYRCRGVRRGMLKSHYSNSVTLIMKV